ncbi:copper chaperone PCu(A)C [Bradyrhizobium ontarionense]|uniref:Copper chaperone PCu(A)C n=1 Tax=Bradyrhizobium ontarionense TaxID=2898149 RepID=A0ABY3RJI6_9BRAD|nr:copper chaperone PCu(A)C [Bradyrhizobium sp. A19]UFZ07629.1 copper chaperone PCu(A)C [Bradyrhizobium sp. A19]
MSEHPARLERDQIWSAPSEGSVQTGGNSTDRWRGPASPPRIVSEAVARRRDACRKIAASGLLVALAALILPTARSLAASGEGLTLSEAWVPATPEVGRDIPLLVTIRNDTTAPEALMRVRCPVANFSERHTVDRGEGAPAMRSIPSIPIPAGSTLVLQPTAYHVMLLQTREPLEPGKRFSCTIVFQKAGSIETEVEIRKSP